MLPTIYVITPTYNHAELLPRALDSVIAQEWQEWQIVLVDDGSTDNTPEVVAAYQEKLGQKLTFIQQKNGGSSSARNTAIEWVVTHSRHPNQELITFLDSDDLLLPQALRRIDEEANREPEIRMFLFGAADQEGRKTYRTAAPRQIISYVDYLTSRKLRGEMLAATRVNLFADPSLRFDDQINAGEALLWWRAAKVTPILVVDEVLRTYYTDHTNSITRGRLTTRSVRNLQAVTHKTLDGFAEELKIYNPSLLGAHYLVLARTYALLGNRKSSLPFFWKGVRYAPLDLKRQALYLVALLDRNLVLTNLLVRHFS